MKLLITKKICTKCKDGYVFINNNKTRFCYSKLEIDLTKYNIYPDTNIYNQCYKNCYQCYSPSTSESHNCLYCAENYFFYYQKNEYGQDIKFCINNCPSLFPFSTEDHHCYSHCPDDNSYADSNNKCISQCDESQLTLPIFSIDSNFDIITQKFLSC